MNVTQRDLGEILLFVLFLIMFKRVYVKHARQQPVEACQGERDINLIIIIIIIIFFFL